ncbi:sugar ABC transporter substrate-binding protein [Paenibacillus marchantiophytorum]|uniref:Sugar ABC transporter substrate-binding protein n=1 Tax=Paenibacillus marchantiophytorum TaxID=1619310 RepID=A0ABQ2BSF9_9BACL|nr:extracellular solute-binding protein [Paenibacillus marchantiophytorum]GGI46555.1 sugar ABC transporter substrate-binding protein [Paenibacillus marchantiophytorum]
MKNKKWVQVSLLSMSVVAFTGCSSTPSAVDVSAAPSAKATDTAKATDKANASTGKVKLTLWYWNGSVDEALYKKVSEQFPNIELDAQNIGGDFRSKLLTTLSAGSGAPDITGLNEDVQTYMGNKDKFYNLLDLGADSLKADYLPWKWNAGLSGDGKFMLGFPMDTGPTALYYRADLFKNAGLPYEPADVSAQIKTWDNYLDAGKKIRDTSSGKVFLIDNAISVYNQYFAQQDKAYFDNNDNFIGDQPHIKAGWDLTAKFTSEKVVAGVANWTPEWNSAANNGKFASFVGASWMKSTLQAGAPDTKGKWRVAPAPGEPGNNGGSFLAIPKQSKHPKEAFEVIKWLENAQNQANSYASKGLFPSTLASYPDPKMNLAEDFFGGQKTGEIFSDSAKKVKPKFLGLNQNIATTAFNDELTNMEKSGKDPNKALKDAIDNSKKKLSQITK